MKIISLILLMLLTLSLSATSLLPNSETLFKNKRSTVAKADQGYSISVSGDIYSETAFNITTQGELQKLNFNIQTVAPFLNGYMWVKIVDGDNEEYRSNPNIIIPRECQNGKSFEYNPSSFTRCSWSKKGDGVITEPVHHIVFVFNPAPQDKGKTQVFNLKNLEGTFSKKPNEWDERLAQLDSAWDLKKYEGAEGTLTKNSDGTFSFEKHNALGYIELRLKEPVHLEGEQRYFFRAQYQSKANPLGSLLMLRHASDKTSTANLYPSGSQAFSTDSLLLNTPSNGFGDILYYLSQSTSHDYYPVITLLGNPAKVTLKDITLDKYEKKRERQTSTPAIAKYTIEQVKDILKTRESATAKLVTDSDGNVSIFSNGKKIPSCFYKPSLNIQNRRIEDFSEAGVPFVTVDLPTCTYIKNRIVLGKGKYDYKMIDDIIYDALCHNPYAKIILNVSAYEPYIGWGDENYDEIWQNEKGVRALGNNVHLKFFSNNPKQEKFSEPVSWWPSYSSEKWQADYAQVFKDILKYAAQQPYGKAIAGVSIWGGGDGQFQYRVGDDFSPPAQKAFREYLTRRYKNIAALNKACKTSYKSFSEIEIPVMNSLATTPFIATSIGTNYREFQCYVGWTLRERFAAAIKAGANKDILTLTYGIPDSFLSNCWELATSLDSIITIIGYPHRRNGSPFGAIAPELSYKLHNKLHLQEIDARSWRSNIVNEVTERWLGGALTPEAWKHTERKLVGASLAARMAWWYYTLAYQEGGGFFDAPEIMDSIKECVDVANKLNEMPVNPFRPDVCVILGDTSDIYIPTKAYSSHGNLNALGNAIPMQMFMLESSGVPYDKIYMKDLMKHPDRWDYKVYIFAHTPYFSKEERNFIDTKLKNNNRTIVWIYAPGYIDETGKSPKNIQKLTGFEVETKEKFARKNAIAVATQPLMKDSQGFISFGDMRLSVMNISSLSVWGTIMQSFELKNLAENEILALYTDNKIAGGVRKFKNWRSIYLADSQSLSNVMLNNIAKDTNSYCTGKAGHSIFMNGNFVSIHGLYDDEYLFTLPAGANKLVDAFTGEVLGTGPEVKITIQYGKTRWFFLTK